MADQLPALIPVPLLVLSILAPVVGMWRQGLAFWLAVVTIAFSTAMSGWALAHVIAHGPMSYALGGWEPPIGIEYVVDHVAAFVSLIVMGVALAVVVGTRRMAEQEMRGRQGLYYSLVLLLLAGLTGIIVTADLFNLFVFLEISSLAAYALVFLGGRKGMLAGYRYLILGTLGGAFYLLGVAFLYFGTGTLNMGDTLAILSASEATTPVSAGAVFIFIGLGLKMALVPLHLWLPDAYTFSPSSVNTLIAPIMTKVGAYAMLRMFLSVFPEGYLVDEVPIGQALVVLGAIGVVFGAAAAFRQQDIRRLLAYSSVSQLAFIAIGIGLATPLGFVAALLHIMNHALMKGTLFLAVMAVRLRTGVSEVPALAGLGRRLPVTAAAFTVGAISMVGVPPTAGFFSKWYLSIAAVEQGLWVILAVVLISSLLSAAYLFRVLERAYLAQPPAATYGAHDGPVGEGRRSRLPLFGATWDPKVDVLLPLVLLAAATIVLGVLNVAVVRHVLEPGT